MANLKNLKKVLAKIGSREDQFVSRGQAAGADTASAEKLGRAKLQSGQKYTPERRRVGQHVADRAEKNRGVIEEKMGLVNRNSRPARRFEGVDGESKSQKAMRMARSDKSYNLGHNSAEHKIFVKKSGR